MATRGSVLEAKVESAVVRLDALFARLDAKRKSPEGQLGLFGDGAGGGKACGGGWIRPDYTCHKEGGAQPAQQQEAPYEARRSRPKETIYFPQPIEGPSGAKLQAYTWQYTVEEVLDNRGELAERRVSDWEKSLANVETGRNVVHQFEVEVNGETKVVSAESAIKLLGYVSESDKKAFGSLKSTARTVARLRMAQHELDQTEQRWQKDWDEVELAPKPQIEVGEWSKAPPDWSSREGYRRRTWKLGDIEVDQIWNSLGVDSDEDQAAHLFARWKANEMEKRGWGYSGQGKTSMSSYITRTRDDLQKRIARAEAKLQQTARQDADNAVSRLLDVLNERLDALKRKCSTGYGCGSTCISVQKECRSVPGAASSKERLQRLEQLARGEIKPRGIGVLKPEEARAKAAALAKPSTPAPAKRTTKPKRTGKPSVVVNLRRAKPGGEYGPDGHWYPGGAWMSEGSYVGIKPEVRPGTGEGRDLKGKGKSGPETPKVVQPREKPRRLQPTEPKGEGLPRPTGLKKIAQKNDEEFFNDRGYISERLPYGDQRLNSPAFQAAVAQRMTTEELNWATDQILRVTGMSKDDFDFGLYGGEKEALDYNRSLARNQLTGVDDDRLKAAIVFMEVSRNLGYTSPAQKRLRERRNNYETQSTAPQRKPRAQVEGKRDPGYGDFVWALNNVFRAVRIRRGGSNA